jgi:iron complex outermembrane receptor protein
MQRRRLGAMVALLLGGAPHLADAGGDDVEAMLGGAGDITEVDLVSLLDAEVVSASKLGERLQDAPAVVSVIGRQELVRRNVRSVAEALQLVPGLYVSYDYVMHDVGVRGVGTGLGGGSRLIKVMIDGHPVAFRADASNFLGPELVPMAAVERIEVIRGPASALYGADALLGVVNVITRSGRQMGGAELRLGGHWWPGSPGMELSAAGGEVFGPLDLALAVQGAHLFRDGLRPTCSDLALCRARDPLVLERETDGDLERPLSLVARATLELDRRGGVERGRLRLLGNYQHLDVQGGFPDWGLLNYDEVELPDGTLQRRSTGNRTVLDNAIAAIEYDSPPLFTGLVRLHAGARHARGGPGGAERLRDTAGFRGPEADYQAFSAGQQLFETRDDYGHAGYDLFADLSAALPVAAGPLDELRLLIGADHVWDRVSLVQDASATPPLYRTAALRNLGIYGQVDASLLDARASVVAGVRLDQYDGQELGERELEELSGAERARLCDQREPCYRELSHRLGVSWRFGPALQLKALWGTAFKAPSPVLLYHDGVLGERPVNRNPALRPQRVNSAELQASLQFLDGRLVLLADAFFSHLGDKAEFVRAGLAIRAENAESVASLGLESELHYVDRRLSAYLGGAVQRSRRSFPGPEQDRITETFGVPALMARGGSSILLPWAPVRVGGDLSFVGARVGSFLNRGGDNAANRYTLSPYALVDLYASSERLAPWGGRETRIGLGVYNLLDTAYEYPGFQPYYRIDIPGQPRRVLLTLSQQF